MPAPSWENADAFLQLDDFAIEATVTPQGGVSRTIRGIFDDPYLNAQLGEYEADASDPRLTCKETDVADLAEQDQVQIGAKNYYLLTAPQPDGTGFAVLRMAED
ncbi:head-tail joining protein [Leisingera sp. D0M16]|uniref:head-tail joining protein n=1 Tax=Leisingera coralii TaxID=3351347 RepID=UPI003B79A530